MLSLFPFLLSFGLISPFLLRITVALIGLKYGIKRYNKSLKWLSILYIVFSFFIFIGLFTQIFALLGIALAKLNYYLDRKYSDKKPDMGMHIVVIIILLSLVFTGPGFLAFDLPL
ncbi:MAG: hypothetical protein WC095_01030 [Candidatus Paceibacterota bacterium]